MKKYLLLILCLVLTLTAFVSCASGDDEEEDKGPTIPVYLSTEIANFDPAYGNLDDASAKIFSLIYEGLYKYNAKGKPVMAQAASFKILDKPEEDYYAVEIKLKNTCWSDGTQVQAQDYIYAWQRLLQPGFQGEAASLLFDIKNARLANQGECSIEDFGVTDSGVQILRITFEGPTDYEKFKEYLASPMLVPVREVAVGKTPSDWSSNASILVTNGPFTIRSYVTSNAFLAQDAPRLIIERNIYYMRNVDKDSVNKYVTPYRLYVDLTKDAAKQEAMYQNDELAYNSEIALSERLAYYNEDLCDVNDTMSVMTYVFNTEKAPFDDPYVRLALSQALDRNAIADKIVFAKPAEGIIADGVFNTNYKDTTTFRKAGGSLIDANANLELAKQTLAKANYTEKNIDILVRNNDVDYAVAKIVKDTWEKLGFNVTITRYAFKEYKDEKEYLLVVDTYLNNYLAKDFQVVSVDYLMFSTDAFANLATFSPAFASGYIDMSVESDSYDLTPHVSGYKSEEYTSKIEAAFAEKKDLKKRAQLLHEAEEILMNDMPIIPLVQLQNGVVKSNIKGVKTTYYGYDNFVKATLKDLNAYITEEE